MSTLSMLRGPGSVDTGFVGPESRPHLFAPVRDLTRASSLDCKLEQRGNGANGQGIRRFIDCKTCRDKTGCLASCLDKKYQFFSGSKVRWQVFRPTSLGVALFHVLVRASFFLRAMPQRE